MDLGAARIDPNLLLRIYALGIFPMAESRDATEVMWVDPQYRGILPLDGFHVPRRLARTVRADPFDIRIDTDFPAVIAACAAAEAGRGESWINPAIADAYCELAERGHAHSIESWRDGRLAGGLYGVSMGAAFFGESMFSMERDASKVALVHLAARLKGGGYRLLDTQFVTAHLRQFGAIEIPRGKYHDLLRAAIDVPANFHAMPEQLQGAAALHLISHTS